MLSIALWTTLQSPSDSPAQVRIAFGDDPKTMMSVAWQVQASAGNPMVEFGTSARFGRSVPAKRTTYPYETGQIWEAALTRLKPGTIYHYRIVDGASFSQTFSFKTAPPDPASFAFTAYGDHGVTAQAATNVQNVLRERPAFHLLLGDVSYANGNQPVWDSYLSQIEPMTSVIPFMLTLGNHENETVRVDGKPVHARYAAYLARFALPQEESRYVFDYGNARFVAFNSDDYRDPVQLAWLRATLAAARVDKRVKWVVVFQHHPPYGSSKGRGDNLGLIGIVTPIYDEFKVDLVLSGHDHHYERQYPLRAGRATSGLKSGYKRGEGTLYMVQGGGGKSLYDFADPQPSVCAFREKSNGYLLVTVRRKGPLTIEAKRLDGSLMEKIEVVD